MNGSTPTPTTRVDVPVSSVASPKLLNNVQRLLDLTPADDYSVWFENACALKRLGIPYEFFRRWSAKSEKFDEDECAQKWEELPDEPRSGWPTLVKNAVSSSFVPFPEKMLPVPQTEDECAAQAAHYLATTFKPHELFEICEFEQKPTAGLLRSRSIRGARKRSRFRRLLTIWRFSTSPRPPRSARA